MIRVHLKSSSNEDDEGDGTSYEGTWSFADDPDNEYRYFIEKSSPEAFVGYFQSDDVVGSFERDSVTTTTRGPGNRFFGRGTNAFGHFFVAGTADEETFSFSKKYFYPRYENPPGKRSYDDVRRFVFYRPPGVPFRFGNYAPATTPSWWREAENLWRERETSEDVDVLKKSVKETFDALRNVQRVVDLKIKRERAKNKRRERENRKKREKRDALKIKIRLSRRGGGGGDAASPPSEEGTDSPENAKKRASYRGFGSGLELARRIERCDDERILREVVDVVCPFADYDDDVEIFVDLETLDDESYRRLHERFFPRPPPPPTKRRSNPPVPARNTFEDS